MRAERARSPPQSARPPRRSLRGTRLDWAPMSHAARTPGFHIAWPRHRSRDASGRIGRPGARSTRNTALPLAPCSVRAGLICPSSESHAGKFSHRRSLVLSLRIAPEEIMSTVAGTVSCARNRKKMTFLPKERQSSESKPGRRCRRRRDNLFPRDGQITVPVSRLRPTPPPGVMEP